MPKLFSCQLLNHSEPGTSGSWILNNLIFLWTDWTLCNHFYLGLMSTIANYLFWRADTILALLTKIVLYYPIFQRVIGYDRQPASRF